MKKKTMIRKVMELVGKIPIEKRRKLGHLEFAVIKDAFRISEGEFVKAQYLRDNIILFFEDMIKDDDELKEVLKHELCHHLGMNEKQVRNYLKERK